MWHSEELEYMDTLDSPWCWYYLADCGRWHKFEDDPTNPLQSGNIEKYYQRDPKAAFNISSSNCHIKTDFLAMLQTDTTTGRQRRILRSLNIQISCSCYTAAPVFWEMVDPTQPFQLIRLSEPSPEYKTVADYVKKDGLLDRSIISICRIQNLDVWEMYCCKKRQLMRIQGVSEIQERRLFHGTDINNVDSICKYNFDVRLSGQHGAAFGKGVYFARHASYADKYSKSSTDPGSAYGNTKIMFLARVMIGKPSHGQPHFKKPDHGCSENSHDSCVDKILDPNIFVIFDSSQIYPEYLIHYK